MTFAATVETGAAVEAAAHCFPLMGECGGRAVDEPALPPAALHVEVASIEILHNTGIIIESQWSIAELQLIQFPRLTVFVITSTPGNMQVGAGTQRLTGGIPVPVHRQLQ